MKKFQVNYSIQGIMTFMPTYIDVYAKSEEDIADMTDEQLKKIVLSEEYIAREKGIDSVTIYRTTEQKKKEQKEQ